MARRVVDISRRQVLRGAGGFALTTLFDLPGLLAFLVTLVLGLLVRQSSDGDDIDIQPLVTGKSKEVKRTHFKGEAMFTSAIVKSVPPIRLTSTASESVNARPSSSNGCWSSFSTTSRERRLRARRS